MAATDENEGTPVPPTAEAGTPATPATPAAPKKRAPRAAKPDAKSDAAPGATPAAKPDPATLAAEIEKTREDLADTLDAIAEKVSPKRVAKRTTKKVTTAVKDTATSAKDKVSGGNRTEQSWAPPAPKERPVAAVPAADLSVEDATHPLPLPTAEPVEVPADIASGPAKPWYAPPAASPAPVAPSAGPLVRPEYIAVGAVAALVAWFLVRRRH